MTEKPKIELTETAFGRAVGEAVTQGMKAARQTPVQRATAQIAVVARDETKRPKSGYAFIGAAVVIVTVEMIRYWLFSIRLMVFPEVIAFVFAFVGFWLRDPKQTKAGATILVDLGTRVIAVVRTGKRSGDVKAVEVEKPAAEEPSDEARRNS